VTARTLLDIDRELASRSEKVDAMGATLVELDAHPGLTHVKRYPPTGLTATRWAVAEEAHGRLWADLVSITGVLDRAKALRGTHREVSPDVHAELTKLLYEQPIEVSRERIPLAQRTITTRAERIEYIGIAEISDRMSTDYRTVVDFLDAVDGINSRVVTGLAPVQDDLDRAGLPSPKDLVDLLAVSATDPLSLTDADLERRLAAVVADVEARSAELAELAALQGDWYGAVQDTAGRLDALRDTAERAARARAHVMRAVLSSPLPEHPDAEPELRAELRAFTAPNPSGLRALRRRIADAQQVMDGDEQLAQGLLDRRDELSGRLTAYQAKAARLGFAEDPDLLASGRIAAGLLSRRPCDLRAVTRAIADYQNEITRKREAT
jgi:hypothetical protein